MITRIDLSTFKCFELIKLPLGRLTLLSGSNASGKSSFLQALALIHQTMLEKEWSTKLLLNGQELSLGTVTDVVDKVGGRRAFSVSIVDGDRSISWRFEGERRDMSMHVRSVSVDGNVELNPSTLRFLLPPRPDLESLASRLRNLCYLTAERMGPREYYPVEDPSSIQVIGARGERAVGWLYCERDASVQPELALPSAPPTRLRQVEERMRRFFPGFSLDVQQIPQTNVVTLGLRTSEATDYHRPIHVGFGLTQVLPIVVAALSTQRGGILLVENPEVHLHPAGQTRMGSFLADVAASGVQVLVETHSDHVLNGVRLAVKMKRIVNDDVQLHFFRDRGLHSDQVVSPMIGPDGILDYWPEGFFDQFDKDMNDLAGWPD